MIKRIFFISFFVLILVSSVSKASTATDVQQKYNQVTSWQADFVQSTYVEMLKETVEKTGRIRVKRPGNLRIEYDYKDDKKIYASNGKFLWVYKDKEDKAYLFKKPKKVISKEAFSFLTGLKDLNAIFDVLDDLKEDHMPLKISNSKLKKVYLVPKEAGASILRLILGVRVQDGVVEEAVLMNSSGNTTHYKFSKVQFDPQLNESLFVLPETPKREIVKK